MNINDELKEWMVGDYTRLSKEDGDKEESDSIGRRSWSEDELLYKLS